VADKKILKQDMVAEAVAAGHDKPAAGVAYILEQHGVTMTADAFSQAKKAMAKKAKAGGGAEKRVAQPKASTPGEAPRANGKQSAAGLARQVKTLVAEHGAHEVAAMLEVFKK
jgi:adenosylmethionine-8-amino-7-oxononanoate aminotransferase